MKSSNVIDVYEKDGEETEGLTKPTIEVVNHWNRKEFVVLNVGGKKYTVLASDLERAINNATNAHRF